MKEFQYKPILFLMVACAVTAFYFVFNPAEYSFFPKCVFSELTGYQCSGCGGQRAFHQLLHGNFEEAFKLNFLIYIVLPIVGLKLYNRIFHKTYLESFLHHKITLIIFFMILIVFGIVRNL